MINNNNSGKIPNLEFLVTGFTSNHSLPSQNKTPQGQITQQQGLI